MGCITLKKIPAGRERTIICKPVSGFSTTENTDNLMISNLSDYISLSFIGAGAFSEVLKCQHRPSNGVRALKITPKHLLVSSQVDSQAFLKEVSILKKLKHSKIVNFFESFEDKRHYYIVTELCEGDTLYNRLRRAGKFSEKIVLEIMQQVLEGVSYIHSQNVVHRDIKLENILFVSPDRFDLKIADFGNSSTFSHIKKPQGLCGTLHYLAPEVHKKEYDEKVDIWSCGILAYMLLTGRSPYRETASKDIIMEIDQKIFTELINCCTELSDDGRDLLNKMLEKDPEKRISASEALMHSWFYNHKDIC
ncbi:hypothetical protein SteCoe_27286 [Stentor coeruleus]|uniref:non-specific serine/threonine protein kinase n=1 Tax=Stentor coeruleus TaxID=5963 RepID=A0A1R2BAX8_9CILI|nr:hypothetical protein SteCoe_27286 [Stentor coeruleus]